MPVPSFADRPYTPAPAAPPLVDAPEPWLTPEGIPVKAHYTAADIVGLPFVDSYPGIAPYVRGPYPTMYVNQPWTIRQYAGFSTAEDSNSLLPPQPRGGTEGPLRRLRSRDASRLRQRPPPRVRRCRHGRRRDRFHLRHAHALLRHSARRDERVDDDERRRAAGARALCRRRGRTGRVARKAHGHDPERHPQRIHGAQHLHLSAKAFDAHHLGHLCVHIDAYAEIQFDLDLRLSHAGGRRDAGPRARLHARRRRRIYSRGCRCRNRHRQISRRACRSSGRSA